MPIPPLRPIQDFKNSNNLWLKLLIGIPLALLALLAGLLGFGVIGGITSWHTAQNQTPSSALSAAQLATKALEQQQTGNLPAAEQSLEEALVKENKPDYRSQLAVVKYRLKKYNDSITEYKKLVAANQDPAFAWNGIGNAYRDWATTEDTQKGERRAQAVAAYKQSIARDAGYVAAYSNLAVLLNDMGNHAEAVRTAQDGFSATKHAELKDLAIRL